MSEQQTSNTRHEGMESTPTARDGERPPGNSVEASIEGAELPPGIATAGVVPNPVTSDAAAPMEQAMDLRLAQGGVPPLAVQTPQPAMDVQKLAAELAKLDAETNKLHAETDKLKADAVLTKSQSGRLAFVTRLANGPFAVAVGLFGLLFPTCKYFADQSEARNAQTQERLARSIEHLGNQAVALDRASAVLSLRSFVNGKFTGEALQALAWHLSIEPTPSVRDDIIAVLQDSFELTSDVVRENVLQTLISTNRNLVAQNDLWTHRERFRYYDVHAHVRANGTENATPRGEDPESRAQDIGEAIEYFLQRGVEPPDRDLSGLYLCGLNLAAMELPQFVFDDAILAGTHFNRARLERSTFVDADLELTEFSDADLREASFRQTVFDPSNEVAGERGTQTGTGSHDASNVKGGDHRDHRLAKHRHIAYAEEQLRRSDAIASENGGSASTSSGSDSVVSNPTAYFVAGPNFSRADLRGADFSRHELLGIDPDQLPAGLDISGFTFHNAMIDARTKLRELRFFGVAPTDESQLPFVVTLASGAKANSLTAQRPHYQQVSGAMVHNDYYVGAAYVPDADRPENRHSDPNTRVTNVTIQAKLYTHTIERIRDQLSFCFSGKGDVDGSLGVMAFLNGKQPCPDLNK